MLAVDPDKPTEYTIQKIINTNLDQVVLLEGQVLVARSSTKIIFYKIIKTKSLLKVVKRWQPYHELSLGGFIH